MKKKLLLLLLAALLVYAEEKHTIIVKGKPLPLTFDHRRQVWVIEGEALHRFPGLNLAHLVSLVGNIQFTCRGNFQADPQTGGFHQEQLLVMIDGVPVNNAQTGHHNFLLPFVSDWIEKIEILPSAATAFNGSGGVAGAVNIITSRENGFRLSLGGFGSADASMQWTYKGFSFSSGISATSGYMPGIDGRKSFARFSLKLPAGRSYMEVWGGWTQAGFGAKNFYTAYNSYEEVGRFIGALLWRSSLSERTSLEASYSAQFSDDRFTLLRDAPSVYFNHHRTWQHALETSVRTFSLPFSLRTGLQLRWDHINSAGIRSGTPAAALGLHQRAFYSLFGDGAWEKGRFFSQAMLRLQGGTWPQIEGQVTSGFRISSMFRCELSLCRTTRIPTFTELYYSDPQHRSNPDLEPEKTIGIQAGFNWRTGSYEGSLRWFSNRTTDMIDWLGSDTESVWTSSNVREGLFRGIHTHHSLTGVRDSATLFYSFQTVQLNEPEGLQPLKYHYYIADHILSLQYHHDFPFFSFSTLFKLEREYRTHTLYPHMNLRIMKKLGGFTLFFDILNLYNTRIEKIPGLPEAPRMLQVGVIYRK